MSEQDDAFEARIRRTVADAGDDAPAPPSINEMLETPRAKPDRVDPRRKWVAGGAIGLVAAAVIALLVVPGNDDDAIAPADTPPTVETTSPAPPATTVTTDTTVTADTTVTTEPIETVPSTTTSSEPATSVEATAPTSTPTTTEPDPTDPAAVSAAIDLADATVFGFGYGTEADPDEVIADIEPALGDPTFDTGWQPTPTSFNPNFDECFGPRFRTVWWGDFRLTFGEFEDERVRVAAWSVGDPSVDTSAPLGDLPPTTASGVAADGVGVGSTRAEVLDVVPQDGRIIGDTEDGVVVTGAIVTTFEIDDTDTVTAIGSGRLDCVTGPDL